MTDLTPMVRQLARLRAELQIVSDATKRLKAEWEQRPDVKANTDAVRTLTDQLTKVEADLRAAALAEFQATADKHPHPAVSIKLTNSLSFDVGEALAWAREHMPVVLTLDTKAFGKAIKALPLMPECVKWSEVPTTNVATDLTEYLGVDPDADAKLAELRGALWPE